MYKLEAIGTDTELFLRDKEGNPVPVCGRLGGTKESPRPVPALGKGFAVQEDNVMVEFNLPPVTRGDGAGWLHNCQRMRDYLQFYFEGQGLSLAYEPAMRFSPHQLNSQQAQTFGCDPDYSVWLMQPNFVDTGNPELQTLRTAGGHIHVSFSVDENNTPPGVEEVTRMVKLLDLFVGVPSVLAENDTTRRAFYGKAGAFRPKSYGLEYRVLSGFWFAKKPLCQWVFDAVHDAFRSLRARRAEGWDELLENYAEQIQQTINTGNKEMANRLVRHFDLRTPHRQREDEAEANDIGIQIEGGLRNPFERPLQAAQFNYAEAAEQLDAMVARRL